VLKSLVILAFPLLAFGETYFGYRGDEGRRGNDGRDGVDGYDQTIRTSGERINLELSGSDGYDGRDGQPGEDAFNCRHNFPSDNMRGVRGGNGGNGGDGGLGGNGGNVTIYYTDIAHLKNVYIRSQGGRSGRPGYGGDGGYGCRCPSPIQWTRRVCWTEKDKDGKSKQVCENRNFYCNEGPSGYRGDQGRQPADGTEGGITIIHSNDVLPPDRTTADVDFSYLDGANFSLTKNIFKEQSGARYLLAPGSLVRDNYYAFSETRTSVIQPIWSSRRSAQAFAGAKLSFRLLDQSLSVTYASHIWSEIQITPTASGYKVDVQKIVYANETDELQFDGILGSGRNLKLYVRDSAQISDQVYTSFWMKYESDGFFNHTRFEGNVAAQLINLKDHVYEIDVGQLPIEEKHLKSGEDIKITVEATRWLGTGQNQQKLKSDFKIQ